MKRLIVLLVLIFSLVGCSKNNIEIKEPSKDGTVLLIQEKSDEIECLGYTISLHSNRIIEKSYEMCDSFDYAELTEEEYKKIIDFAFSDKILDIKSNINNEKNHESKLYLYFEDESQFVLEDHPITDKNYLELINILNEKIEK